jgi:hypothetical protein
MDELSWETAELSLGDFEKGKYLPTEVGRPGWGGMF